MAVSADDRRARFRQQALPARVISGVSLSLISLAAAWAGGWIFNALAFVVLIVGLWEFLRLCLRSGYKVLLVPGLMAGFALLVLAVTHDAGSAGAVFVAVGVWMIAVSLRGPLEGRMVGLAMTALAVAYVVGLGIHIIWLRQLDQGLAVLILTLLGTWAADTFAFFVGIRFGRTPLAPQISPGKSVEGFWGGVLGSVLVVLVGSRLVLPELALWWSVVTGLAIGSASPLGDLLESLFKRSLHVKDTSGAIPGHGGVLDRIDSLLLTGPVSYYLFRFFLS